MSLDDVVSRCWQRLADQESRQLLRSAKIVESLPDGRCRINGRSLVNFGGNDYLGLAHEVGQQVDWEQMRQLGATASALVTGRSPWHARLEDRLAEFERSEAALLFPSGYAANLGVLGSLVEDGDAIFCDRDNHASLIDGARMSQGRLFVYRRDQLDRLSESIKRRRSDFRNVFIVTDGVFSMDGEIAPLADLCSVAEHRDCAVIVDEAHGTGVIGATGRGACELEGVEERVLLRVGTLSKALGGLGGFAVSRRPVIEVLRNFARTQFFSTSLPPLVCAAMCESLEVIDREPNRRTALATLTASTRSTISAAGLSLIGNGTAPIVPIAVHSENVAIALAKFLQARGFLIPAIRPPTVPAGTTRLRMSLTFRHHRKQVEEAMDAIVAGLNDQKLV